MNCVRGETALEIGGEIFRLCLTLGGLAELESEFECQSLSELQTRLKNLSANELRRVVRILLIDEVAEHILDRVSPGIAARAVGEAFHAALG